MKLKFSALADIYMAEK